MTYEYLCTACDATWEEEQSISAAPTKVCPTCHRETAKRQVSGGAGFILKGGGWYADLYGSSKPKSGDGGGSSGSSSSSGASTKGDSSSSGSSSSSDSGSAGSSDKKGKSESAPAA